MSITLVFKYSNRSGAIFRIRAQPRLISVGSLSGPWALQVKHLPHLKRPATSLSVADSLAVIPAHLVATLSAEGASAEVYIS